LSPPPVPSSVVQYIESAAKGTGLPESVVAAQNYTESGYGTNDGPSSAGAEGPWQFEPGTWPSYSSLPFTDADQWPAATAAYIAYMKVLLKLEHGDVRNALAAYNAGPGNISAGYGYADGILSMAGQSPSITVASGGGTNTATDTGSGILSWPGQITGFFSDADTFITKLAWIVEPGSWLRIGSFMLAVILLIGALIIFTHADEKIGSLPMPMPVPV
jgi:hypothetical protein